MVPSAEWNHKRFHGSIWKQYHAITNYINENYLNTITLREDGKAENRKISNFPYVSVEEMEVLGCAESTAAIYIKRLDEELKLISPVEGQGKGKYRFIS